MGNAVELYPDEHPFVADNGKWSGRTSAMFRPALLDACFVHPFAGYDSDTAKAERVVQTVQ